MVTTAAPGVYVTETIVPPAYANSNPDITSFTACFIGWTSQGPIFPTLIVNWNQFVTTFGGFSATVAPSDLAMGVYTYFANGGNGCYVIRVPGSGGVEAANVLLDATPASTIGVFASNAGVWGNTINISTTVNTNGTFNLFVLISAPMSRNLILKESWTNLSMVQGSSTYFATVINNVLNGSAYISVSDIQGNPTTPGNTPAVQSVVLGVGTNSTPGVNGSIATPTQLQSAIPLLDTLDCPLLINLPNVNNVGTIAAFVTYVQQTRAFQDSVVFIDTPMTTPATVTSAVVSYAATLPVSSYATVFTPCLIINDPTSSVRGATRTVPPCGSVLGVMASMDGTVGVAQPTAGVEAVVSALSLERSLTLTDIGTMNSAQINVIRFLQGSGLVIWGSNTLSSLVVNQFLSVRRTLIYIEANMRSLTQFAPFQNNGEALWNSITQVLNTWLTSFAASGGLAAATSVSGAFSIICDDTNNSSSSPTVNVSVGVAVQDPAVFIYITVSQGVSVASVTETTV